MSSTPASLDSLFDLVGRRAGLAFPASRRGPAEDAMRRALARVGLTDLTAYLLHLERTPAAFDELLDELTVGETYFFRDLDQFTYLEREILPAILRRRGSSPGIRAWSAACATGEEPYSLAVTLTEAGFASNCYLLATDLSLRSLKRAHRGNHYRRWSLRGAGAARMRAYLRPTGETYTVAESLRRRVTFRRLNLACDDYPSPASGVGAMDLILCRNVLVYFDPRTVSAVARRLFDSLAPEGCLLTAASDPPLAEFAPFEAEINRSGVVYRRAAVTPSAPVTVPVPVNSERHQPLFAGPAVRPSALPPTEQSQPATSAVDKNSSDEDLIKALRKMARANPAEAEEQCAEVLRKNPVATELHHYRALLLIDLGRIEDAVQSLRRALFLDRTLAPAHFLLGSLLQRGGDLAGARRAYRNAQVLSLARPADEPVRFAENSTAGELSAAAERALAQLQDRTEAAS